ncbi:glycosyltransferase family 4 protein [Marivita sp. GX14005]|uniref:glycosyltransferase family 4 protein n=1 Tax=Marivita sp. GX14005 TaxID=2942276 RepID=UPI002019CE72|nr:glycosyltransferase family 4 protein [Marivita sp. GX14005]MCL3881739.1 glycosyltransferase family 4 protein [Marivita sp. GX14005]
MPDRDEKDARSATLIVARRLDRMRSGDNAFLAAYLLLCRKAGFRTRLVFAPKRSFGNKAWARIAPELRELIDEIDWSHAFEVNGIWISGSPSVWVNFGRRMVVEVGRKLIGRADRPYPSLLGATLTGTEAKATVERVNRHPSSLLTVEYSSLGPLLAGCKAGTKAVFLHDLFSMRAGTFEAGGRTPDHVVISIEDEAARCRHADFLIHASCVEQQVFARHLPKAAHIWMRPDVPRFSQPGGSKPVPRAVFIGSIHSGNVAALEKLRSAIWPKVRARVPGVKLVILGAIARTIATIDAQDEGLILVGQVDRLEEFGGKQAIGLAPIQFGSGVPIKIVDYLSLGMAVVATKEAIAPFGSSLNGVVVSAQSDSDFVEKVCDLLLSESHRQHMTTDHAELSRRLDNSELVEALFRA